jgi:hypothetical protein
MAAPETERRIPHGHGDERPCTRLSGDGCRSTEWRARPSRRLDHISDGQDHELLLRAQLCIGSSTFAAFASHLPPLGASLLWPRKPDNKLVGELSPVVAA